MADLAQKGTVDYVWQQAIKGLGNIEILVNNAGVGSSANPKPIIDYDDYFWECCSM